MTSGERNRIDGMQNRESRQIYADRHNDRTATGTVPTPPTSGTPTGNGSRNGGWQHAPQAGNTPPTTPTTAPPRRLAQLGQQQRRLPHAAGGGHPAAAGAGAASDHDARLQPEPEPVGRWPQLWWTPLEDLHDREAAIRESDRRPSFQFTWRCLSPQ